MKVYRGSRRKSLTDSFEPEDYIVDWKEGRHVHLTGTIDEYGARHTNLWLEIEDRDVVALFVALLERGNYPAELAGVGARATAKLIELDARLTCLENEASKP